MVFDKTKKSRVTELVLALPELDSLNGYKYKFVYDREFEKNSDVSIRYFKMIVRDLGYYCQETDFGGMRLIREDTCGVCLTKEI